MDKIFLEFLSTTLNVDEAGVASLKNEDGSFKPDALQTLLDKDKARVASLQKGKLDEGYKKAQKEVMTEFEKKVREKYNGASDKVGIELIDAIIESKAPKGDGLTEDAVKKSKWYLDLDESVTKKVSDAVAVKQKELDNYKSGVERTQTLGKVKEAVHTIFTGLKPVLSADAAKAKNQTEQFLKLFESENFRIDEDNRIILLNEDGTDKQDGHAKRIDFAKYVTERAAQLYDFQKAEPRGGAGAAGGAGGGGADIVAPKNRDEYMQMMGKHPSGTKEDTEMRAKITKAWEEQQKSGQ